MHVAIETFTGHGLTADLISSAINSLRNTLNLETNLHFFMDKYMAWGIEAKFVDQKVGLKSRAYSGIVLILAIQWRYIFRIVQEDKIPFFFAILKMAT